MADPFNTDLNPESGFDPAFVDNDLRIACTDAIELVTDYLEAALTADDIERFETHLDHCDGCRIYLDQIKMTVRLIGTVGQHYAGVEFMPANFDQLAAELRRRADYSS